MLVGLCVLHMTNSCNLKCKHCYASAGKKLPDEFTYEELLNVIDQLDDMGIEYITLSGGEPFSKKYVYDVLRYIRQKNIHVMITSNGTLIDQTAINELKPIGIDSIQISLDSFDPKIHDEFRGLEGAFNRSIEAIKLCKKNGIKVSIMSTLSAINRENMDKLIKLALDLGVDGFAMERFVPEGRGDNEREIAIGPQDLKHCLETLYEYQKKSHNCFFTTNDPLFSFVNGSYKLAYDLNQKNPNMCGGCSLGKAAFIITPDAQVGLCTRLYEKIGSIREKPIKEILKNSEVLNKICNRNALKGKCGHCKYKFICGGCRGWAYRTTGDYLGEDSLCWLNESEIA